MSYNVYIKVRGKKVGTLRANRKPYSTKEEAESFIATLETHLFEGEIVSSDGKIVGKF